MMLCEMKNTGKSSNEIKSPRNKFIEGKKAFIDNPQNLKKAIKLCRLFTDNVTRIEAIDVGASGIAWKVKINGESKIYIEKVYKRVYSSDIKAEIRALTLDGCEYIPELLFSGLNNQGSWCLIMEYIDGGILCDHIQLEQRLRKELKRKEIIALQAKQTIAYQIAIALEFLHSKNLTHGDLKSNNVALKADGNVRLIDFGNSRDVKTDTIFPPQQCVYGAPYKVKTKEDALAADIFAYGVTVTEMYHSSMFLFIKTCGVSWIKTGNKDCDKLLRSCLKNRVSDRLKKISGHKYFENVSLQPSYIPGVFQHSEDPLKAYPKFLTKCYPVGERTFSLLFEEAFRIPRTEYYEKMSNEILKNDTVEKEKEAPKNTDSNRNHETTF